MYTSPTKVIRFCQLTFLQIPAQNPPIRGVSGTVVFSVLILDILESSNLVWYVGNNTNFEVIAFSIVEY